MTSKRVVIDLVGNTHCSLIFRSRLQLQDQVWLKSVWDIIWLSADACHLNKCLKSKKTRIFSHISLNDVNCRNKECMSSFSKLLNAAPL